MNYIVIGFLLLLAFALIYQGLNFKLEDKRYNTWLFSLLTQNLAACLIIGGVILYLQYRVSVLTEIDGFFKFQLILLAVWGTMFAIAWHAPKVYKYWSKDSDDIWDDIIEEKEKPQFDGDPTISDEMRKLLD